MRSPWVRCERLLGLEGEGVRGLLDDGDGHAGAFVGVGVADELGGRVVSPARVDQEDVEARTDRRVLGCREVELHDLGAASLDLDLLHVVRCAVERPTVLTVVPGVEQGATVRNIERVRGVLLVGDAVRLVQERHADLGVVDHLEPVVGILVTGDGQVDQVRGDVPAVRRRDRELVASRFALAHIEERIADR